jgi:hypothetical protein
MGGGQGFSEVLRELGATLQAGKRQMLLPKGLSAFKKVLWQILPPAISTTSVQCTGCFKTFTVPVVL